MSQLIKNSLSLDLILLSTCFCVLQYLNFRLLLVWMSFSHCLKLVKNLIMTVVRLPNVYYTHISLNLTRYFSPNRLRHSCDFFSSLFYTKNTISFVDFYSNTILFSSIQNCVWICMIICCQYNVNVLSTLKRNAVCTQELSTHYILWFWNSNLNKIK